MYSHKYNASFMGFAPVNRPAIVVVVTLNGASKFGGAVAAPVFERIATAALRFLDVPKDLPDQEIAAGGRRTRIGPGDRGSRRHELGARRRCGRSAAPQVEQSRARACPRTAPKRVFGPEPPPLPAAPRPRSPPWRPAGPKAPDFRGKTLRDVLEESTALGIQVEFKGTRDRAPAATARRVCAARGSPVKVFFAR